MLQDDFLDTYGNPETFGKAIGGDILNDKKTWLLIMALKEDQTGKLREIIGSNINAEEKISTVREISHSRQIKYDVNRYPYPFISR